MDSLGDGDLAASIFTLAFGRDAKPAFLEELAARNGGFGRQIYQSADASLQLQDFYAAIASPVLKSVSVTFDYQQVRHHRDFRVQCECIDILCVSKDVSPIL